MFITKWGFSGRNTDSADLTDLVDSSVLADSTNSEDLMDSADSANLTAHAIQIF